MSRSRRPNKQERWHCSCYLCDSTLSHKRNRLPSGRDAIAEQTADTTRDDLELWYMEADAPTLEERVSFAVYSGTIDAILAED